VLNAVATNSTPDWSAWAAEIKTFEQAWSYNTSMYPTEASGVPPLATAQAMLSKYFDDGRLSGYTAYPGYDVDTSPAKPQWVQIPGSNNAAAIGPDCPWLVKGDGSSVAACEASCAATSSCNAFNFNSQISDCELRACVDPLHPQLTSYPGYVVWGNGAAPGVSLFDAWAQDAPTLAWLCDLTPACLGINSRGTLISNVTYMSPTQGSTLWVKKSTAAAAPPQTTSGRTAPPAPVKMAAADRPLPSPPASMKKRSERYQRK
jgi:hypothetical protein